MEKSHFPGYSRCTTCNDPISHKDIHNHILNCRPKSLSEKKLCNFCNKQIDSKQFQEHIQNCNEQQNISSKSNLGLKKQCPICHKFVEDLASHCLICGNDENSNNDNGYETPRAESPIQIDKNSPTEIINSKNKQTKFCILCSQQIDESDYENHAEFCSNKQTEDNSSTISKQKQRKSCGLCFQSFDESEYQDHAQSCSNNTGNNNDTNNLYSKRNYSPYSSENDLNSSKKSTISKQKQTKSCALCSQSFDESEYQDHVQFCSPEPPTNNYINHQKKNERKQCTICSKLIDESEYINHVEYCSNDQPSPSRQILNNTDTKNFFLEKRNSSQYSSQTSQKSSNKGNISIEKQTKHCVLCSQSFDESEYQNHVQFCSSEQSTNNYINHQKKNERKECFICSKLFDESEYVNHVQACSSTISPSIPTNDYQINSFHQLTTKDNDRSPVASGGINKKTTQDCIICFKPINLSEYENHVLACIAQTENQSYTSTTNNNLKCLTCKHSINRDDNNYQEMACHSHHIHCLSCLRRSMEEFARNREAPVCHKTLCDYELSRHDISSIPLERRLSDRLLKLVKGQQRPLCTKCHFYIDVNDNENFDEHFELCGDLIPCEYCQLPFSFQQLENHARQCRSQQMSLNEKLINFVMTRTKYPFTKEQIRIFIQQHNKNHRNQSDPSAIIEALAIFGPVFPYEIPTRECGICMESRPYDDIYVFDCQDSHKICYGCYYQSCQAKMTSGEILTCALCTHLLKDGELNQLKIPKDELKKIRDYQMKKTFDIYSSRTKGIIKCPNQNCTWVAQADDPNERFKVQCPQCLSEFCSLCNQQYHYRTTCQQLPQITQRWFFWCENERTRYLTMRAQQDNQYAAQLSEYNRQNNQNQERNNDLRRRYDELMNDEQYKSQNCRLCPSCKRVVQRLEGCDSMICGQDAHGGNVQSGCGTKFNWAQAAVYTAAATQQPRQVILDLPKPDNPVVYHNGVKCDECKNDVNGIRFDCVHCPSLTFCEKCEQQSTLMHSRENQAYQQQQHVFKLIMIPEEEATQF